MILKKLSLTVFVLLLSIIVFKGNREVVKTNLLKASIGTPEDPYARFEYERRMLIDPATGKIPENIRERELKFARTIPTIEQIRLKKNRSNQNFHTLTNWTSIGPDNIGGRTRALAYDISDNTGNTIIAGGVSGGMWITTNGGTSWTRTTTKTQLASVSCLIQDTRTGKQSTWYYGTGEGGSGSSADANGAPYRGNGIFKSTDGGNTWTQLSSTANNSITTLAPFNYVWRLAIDPTNVAQDEVYAATLGGIMRSLDGGTTWQSVLGDSSTGSYTDITVTSGGVVYATISNDANQDAGIWRSTTGDKGDWTKITPTSWPSTYSRITLSTAPSNENIVYFFAITQGTTKGISLWKYTYPGTGNGAGDVNWSDRTAGLPSNFYIQGAYDQYVAVKPDNADFVIIGGSDLLRSTNGYQDNTTNTIIGGTGNTFTGDYPGHFPDQHWAAFKPGSPNVMLSANDGGVFRTDDVTASTVSWTELNNGYETTQYYAIAIDNASTSQIVTGGMQDRGNWFINPVNSHNALTMDDGGFDGAFNAIADNGAFYYSSSQSGGVNRANFDANGNKTNSANIFPQNASGQLFVSPYILDLANTDIMYYLAGGSIWRSTSVSTATRNSGWTELQNSKLNSSTITAIGVSQTNSSHVVYYGTSTGDVYRLDGADSGDPNPVDISTGKGLPSGAYVNCIAVDKTNSNKAILVFSNYGVISLFYTNDAGVTWTNISGNLEEDPSGSGSGPSCRWASILNFNSVTYYYVATSTGVYSTNDISNGPTTLWAQEGSTTIGNVVCPMVLTRDLDGFVAVGTHGNGAFTAKTTVTSVEDGNTIPVSYSLSQNYPNPFNPSTTISFSIPQAGNVHLILYDALGRKVRDIVNKNFSAGNHTLNFNASNLTSGIYFYRIQTDNFTQTKKMVLLQ